MKTDQIQKVHKDWYKLDLSAIVYLHCRGEISPFRVSIVCAVKDIDPEILQRAVNLTMPRFPTYKAAIRRVYSGDIWNRMTDPALCAGGCKEPLPAHAKGNNRYLVRIYYYRNRIALEAHHSLGDGTGGMCAARH